MALARLSMKAFVQLPALQAGEWEELLRSACDSLNRVPEAVMKEISVTGMLSGIDGEALYVLTLTEQLAAEYRVQQVVQLKGHQVTARFWRHAPAPRDKGERQ